MADKSTKSANAKQKISVKAAQKTNGKSASKNAKTAPPRISIVTMPAPSEVAEFTTRQPAREQETRPARVPPAVADQAPQDQTPRDKAEVLKQKDLLDAVVAKTGAKKKDVKDIVEAALAEIAAALTLGHSLALPSLGNVRVAKVQEKGPAKILLLKLRIGGPAAKDGVADDLDEN